MGRADGAPRRVVRSRAGEAFAAIARPTAHVGSHGGCQMEPARLRRCGSSVRARRDRGGRDIRLRRFALQWAEPTGWPIGDGGLFCSTGANPPRRGGSLAQANGGAGPAASCPACHRRWAGGRLALGRQSFQTFWISFARRRSSVRLCRRDHTGGRRRRRSSRATCMASLRSLGTYCLRCRPRSRQRRYQ
jgi:hypothetical protein